MNKESLEAKLEVLKQKSEDTIKKIEEHNTLAKNLREDALIIKGEYQAIEKLIAEISGEIKPKKVKS